MTLPAKGHVVTKSEIKMFFKPNTQCPDFVV